MGDFARKADGRRVFTAEFKRSTVERRIQTYSASRFGDYHPSGQYVARVDASGVDDVRHEPGAAYLLNFPVLVRGAPRR